MKKASIYVLNLLRNCLWKYWTCVREIESVFSWNPLKYYKPWISSNTTILHGLDLFETTIKHTENLLRLQDKNITLAICFNFNGSFKILLCFVDCGVTTSMVNNFNGWICMIYKVVFRFRQHSIRALIKLCYK